MDIAKFLNVVALCCLWPAFHGLSAVHCNDAAGLSSKLASFMDDEFDLIDDSDDEETPELAGPNRTFGPVPLTTGEHRPSNLADALMFLDEFCKGINGDFFVGQRQVKRLGGIKHICGKVSNHVKTFTASVSPLNAAENPFAKALLPNEFSDYADWLDINMPTITLLFDELMSDSIMWIKERDLKTAADKDLSKYGFELKGNKWLEFPKFKLTAIAKLIVAGYEFVQKTLSEADL